MRLTLRDYQQEALKRIGISERAGCRRQLGVAATGLGKTVIFTALAEQRGTRALVLVHRDELVGQAVGKLAEMWPEIGVTGHGLAALRSMGHPAADQAQLGPGVGIVKAAADDTRAHVVVASVQTLSRPARLERMIGATSSQGSLLSDDCPPFGLVIVDEAHHCTADSYRRILTGLRAGEPDGPLLLGVTATPDRGDGQGLDGIFSEIVFNYDILWGIREGYLVDIRGKAVKVAGLDLDQVKTTAGDYQAGDAGRALVEAGAPAIMARAIAKHAADRRTLAFTPTVATAIELASECVGQGLSAAWVSGETDHDDRRRILRDFRNGDIQVVANCAVLTEGFDDPGIGCVAVGRPTTSRGLYVQMIGRGTRPYPEKPDLLVLDVVGGHADHSLVTVPSLFGLGGKLATRARNASATLTELVDEHQQAEVTAGRIRAEDVELFHRVRQAGISWIPAVSSSSPRKRYVRPMPQNGRKEIPTVVLAQMKAGEDVWTAGLQWRSGAQRALIRNVSMDLAKGVAEDAVRSYTTSLALVTTDAPWRAKPPSAKLLHAAQRWRVKVDPAWNAGELSDEINARAEKARHAELMRERRKTKTPQGA